MTRGGLLLTLAMTAALAWACTKPDEPVDPVWGKEPCADCSMLVSDRRYAAQIVHDGERRFFDDIGCLVLWANKHGGDPPRAWVRDAQGGWAPARSARYAPDARTPMDYGIEARAAGPLGWDEVRDRVIARNATKGKR